MCTHHDDQSQYNLPCLHCQPHSYIRMVRIYTYIVYAVFIWYNNPEHQWSILLGSKYDREMHFTPYDS